VQKTIIMQSVMIDILPISFLLSIILIFINQFEKESGKGRIRLQPQTFHTQPTSRLGGISIFSSLFIVTFLIDANLDEYDLMRASLLCAIPAFLVGLLDDLRIEISPLYRLLLLLITPLALFFFANLEVRDVEISLINNILKSDIAALIFIVISIGAMINGFNMIDGFNGLALSYSFGVICSMVATNLLFADINLMTYAIALFFSLLGVFILNFPFGKIFIGDSGAYILGALIPVGLIQFYSLNNLSPWYVLTLLMYPTTEVLFSFIRKIYQKKSPLNPDEEHLHMLIFKRISGIKPFTNEALKHSLVSIIMVGINLPNFILASTNPKDSSILILASINFLIIYLVIYGILVQKRKI